MQNAVKKRKKETNWDFPGGTEVKNPPSNAGYTGLIPGHGTKIPYATRQLNMYAKTGEVCMMQERACMPHRRASIAKKKKKRKERERDRQRERKKQMNLLAEQNQTYRH